MNVIKKGIQTANGTATNAVQNNFVGVDDVLEGLTACALNPACKSAAIALGLATAAGLTMPYQKRLVLFQIY